MKSSFNAIKLIDTWENNFNNYPHNYFPIYKNKLIDFILFLDKNTKILDGLTTRYRTNNFEIDSNILYKLIILEDFYIKNWTSFKPKTYNRFSQLSELLRFLFCKFKTPTFMDSLWFNRPGGYIYGDYSNFIEYGSGVSPKQWSHFNLKFTNKMYHYFINSKYKEFNNAILDAIVKGNEGSTELVNKLINTTIIEKVEIHKIHKFISWISKQGDMISLNQLQEIIDFLYAQHNDFNFKGRTLKSMCDMSNKWHNEIQQAKITKQFKWEPKLKNENNSIIQNDVIYTFKELESIKELSEEGKALHHCVYSYNNECSKGLCSIVSMKKDIQKLLTIEIRNNKICQIKGNCNRLPTSQENNIIYKWAIKNNIKF